MTRLYAVAAVVRLISGGTAYGVDYIEADTTDSALSSAQAYFLTAPQHAAIIWGDYGAQVFMANTVVSVTFQVIGVLDEKHKDNEKSVRYVARVKSIVDAVDD